MNLEHSDLQVIKMREIRKSKKKTYDSSMVLSRNEINITALRRSVTGEM
jgi:hypothetical protein